MGSDLSWEDALMRLHVAGWDTDDIDAACEALVEACGEGETAASSLERLAPAQVDDLLDTAVVAADVPALLTLARVRARDGGEARALQVALYDLDAFAYAYAGDD